VRVLIIDDSAFMRSALRRILRSEPDIDVVGAAANGAAGLEEIARLKPDVVTLDVEMPVMDGLTALGEITRLPDSPAVLMCSSLTQEGSDAALRALSLGASDFIAKAPTVGGMQDLRDEIIAKVLALGKEAGRRSRKADSTPRPQSPPRQTRRAAQPTTADLVVIGSSTGGPPVLEEVLRALPAGFALPIVIAQHMPELFTRRMAERLDALAHVPVRHAEDGMAIRGGVVHIAPGGRHTRIEADRAGHWKLTTSDEPVGDLFKPSVDVLFDSAAGVVGAGVLALVLTGMGRDGARGARALRDAGARVLTQSEHSCVVYGMPRAVDEAGLSSGSYEPAEFGRLLASLARRAAA